MDINNYIFSGNLRAIGASDNYVTLDERTNQIVVCKNDVIALAQHFNVTTEDLES